MFRLRFLLLVSIACLVAAEVPEDADETTLDPPTSDSPDTTSEDIVPGVENLGSVIPFDTTTYSGENMTSTEESSTASESVMNVTSTTESPSSATTLGVSVAGLALLVAAVMS